MRDFQIKHFFLPPPLPPRREGRKQTNSEITDSKHRQKQTDSNLTNYSYQALGKYQISWCSRPQELFDSRNPQRIQFCQKPPPLHLLLPQSSTDKSVPLRGNNVKCFCPLTPRSGRLTEQSLNSSCFSVFAYQLLQVNGIGHFKPKISFSCCYFLRGGADMYL